ncbi:hypothetical protein [Alkaliphilus hydrothermalis]|uniref:S-layer family duplication domain-containing protein n=1 Tax=Alkaliphilus hydrothermalis TaxID=1482730 RepID=A0ABS2NLI0_9FIRM|nr:hypothetical protein [Alkaliphilus hydrothermalis]MBM7613808.1 hypothetical protein [Alkaliphilus hydrothermalis]
MIGDFLVLSLDRKVINYYIKWGAFKVDSGDYKTLKLLKNNLSVGLQGDLAMLERYINSNAKDIDFYYKDEKVYLRKQNGGDELIYPTDELYNNTQKSTTTAVFNNQESGDEAEKSPLVLISLILLLGIGGIVTIRYRNLP